MKKNTTPQSPTDIGTFMVAVGAVIEHQPSQTVLMLRRSQDNYKPGVWELGYGRMDQGEEPQEALRREFNEETGLDDLQLVDVLTAWHFYRGAPTPDNEVVGITFWCTTQTQDIALSHEHDEYRWVSPLEALELTHEPGIQRDIGAYLDKKAQALQLAETADAAAHIAAAKDRQERAIADYHNLLRRTNQERQKITKLATVGLIEDLIQPFEHLALASDQLNDAGLSMVSDQLWQVLGQHGLEEINPLGKPFDVATMEAIESNGAGGSGADNDASSDSDANDEASETDQVVTKVVARGYSLNGTVLQHAKVVLGASS